MQPIYIKYSRNRFPRFQIETSVINDHSTKYVVKRALSEKAYPHIESIYQGFNIFKDAILDDRIKQPAIIGKQNDRIVFEFIEGTNLNHSIFASFFRKDRRRYLEGIDKYHKLLFDSLKTVTQFHLTKETDVFFKDTDIDLIDKEKFFFPYAFIDVAPDNFIETSDESYYFIDYEWILPAMFPVSFVFFRSLFLFYVLKADKYGIEKFLPFDDLMGRYGISRRQIDQYTRIEKNIQNHVSGKYLYNRSRYLKKNVSLGDLMPCLDGTHQRVIKEFEEKSQQWTRERTLLLSQCEQQHEAIQEILRSKSWKLTRPLRWLNEFWR
ncbi:MAG: hypothetical protein MUD09_03970 [Desulfobacterales bacterium]|nr:hypothetical protein [Desulfobacterales bacterium]